MSGDCDRCSALENLCVNLDQQLQETKIKTQEEETEWKAQEKLIEVQNLKLKERQ